MRTSRSGFTLVEVALVIVIIGLITGGLVGGRALIHSGESKVIMYERAKYAGMLFAFRDRYKAMPGDMADAYDMWGAGCGTNATTASTGCNGNGDGIINTATGENIRAWEHLVLAQILPGGYDGTGTVESGRVVASAANVPHSGFTGGYWDLTDAGNNVNGTDLTNRTLLIFGALCGTGSCVSLTQTRLDLTYGTAQSIDKKLDDGMSNTGSTRGSSNCADNGTDGYRVRTSGDNTKGCAMAFILQ